ncbi:hypothetical protein HGM15179_012658 [Zosterops borbonicus]|uniref:Uncharacterized protein n=1 Tax=Zosterops borbonicus TaxID=364589 RepID=A0A8K1LI03_9PASS|nr:hypothetical protein HGM15179_012658 [Zosterops borbonicus]
MDLLLPKAEPLSDIGDASAVSKLKSGYFKVRKRKLKELKVLCDDKIQLCARDTQEKVTREEFGNWDMIVENFTTEIPWSKLRFVSDD